MKQEGNLRSYVIGFVLSIVLTLAAYALVVNHLFSLQLALSIIAGLAIVQFMVQMLFFLHLGHEAHPRWKLVVAVFMVIVVVILVFGSLWIMNNLNYRMSPTDMNNYLRGQDGI
ncbi:MAG TPA: cytochrome o ubiquinol oxidase subunit IV [Candidatus Saccharimonadia bacterium]|jgi:cytochrome o ubiquinol oxidase operon protein cyoD|nr:cytochrome o ubiquinol oxidase subunit IV [Candidatus Saccharimonadia bacterium]